MNDELYEKLAKDNPELFEGNDFELSVGDGWYNIIACLMMIITNDVNQCNYRLRYERENGNDSDKIAKILAKKAEAVSKLPHIDQVKEKFGGLRFYYSGGGKNEYLDGAVSMAEAMASVTCEVCGKPGERRGGGWIRTLCDVHYREAEARNAAFDEEGSVPAKISDDH